MEIIMQVVCILIGVILLFSSNRNKMLQKYLIDKANMLEEQLNETVDNLKFEKQKSERPKKRKLNQNLSLTSKKTLYKYLDIIHNLTISNINGSSVSSSLLQLKYLMEDRTVFMTSTIDIMTIMYPRFMEYLSYNGLNEYEIGICCFYILGLNGNEISSYLNLSSLYNINVLIRKKLSVSRNINLVTFLKEHKEELDPLI